MQLNGPVAQGAAPPYQQMSNTQPGNHNEIPMYPESVNAQQKQNS
jgi:hypothetical protein